MNRSQVTVTEHIVRNVKRICAAQSLRLCGWPIQLLTAPAPARKLLLEHVLNAAPKGPQGAIQPRPSSPSYHSPTPTDVSANTDCRHSNQFQSLEHSYRVA